jgi:predicted dehydrogenase
VAAESADQHPEFRKITADDTFTLIVQFESGARGVVDLFGAAQVRGGSMEAYGSTDSMTVLDGYRLGRPKPDGSFEEVAIPEDLRIEPTPEMPLLAPFLVKVEMIRAAIQEGKPPSPTFRDAVEVQRVLDAARLSDSSGAWETLRS